MTAIVWFEDLKKDDISIAGGKGANLGEMLSAGLPVPPGFAISAQTYNEFLDFADIRTDLEDLLMNLNVDNTEELDQISKSIRSMITGAKMPENVEREIKEAYKKLSEGAIIIAGAEGESGEFVAVRSSATAEDLPDASFAGQQKTLLNVRGPTALIKAVRECWASLFTSRAIFYRAEKGFDHTKVLISVVVQKMVDSEKAGVMFTVDPVTNERNKIAIESAWGLGEAVVSGQITPDHYTVDKETLEVLSKNISEKSFMYTRDIASGNTKQVTLSEDTAKKQVLTENEIKEIANFGRKIEQHYNFPQDIEWAIEDNNVYILQSRPVTTIKDEPDAGEKIEEKPMEEVKEEKPVEATLETPIATEESKAAEATTEPTETQNIPDVSKPAEAGPETPDTSEESKPIESTEVEAGTAESAPEVQSTPEESEPAETPTEAVTEPPAEAVKKETVEHVEAPPEERKPEDIHEVVEKEAPAEAGAAEEVLTKGFGASPGVGAGAVKIIIDTSELSKVQRGDVLVTKMTTPDFVPAMERAVAIVTDEGGVTSHAAIVSRELGIPCIVGTSNATTVLKEGEHVTVDATSGVVHPGVVKEKLEKKLEIEVPEVIEKAAMVTATKVYVNLGVPSRAEEVAKLPVDGVGLMREEFIFASMIAEHPLAMIERGEQQKFIDTLAEGIGTVAKAFYPRPVVLRLSDFKTNEYRSLKGGEKFEQEEANPMLGWRGCSRYVSEKYAPAFKLELKAVKKVRDEKGLKNVWIMLPFVRILDDVKKVVKLMEEEGLHRGPDLKLWMMAEVPSNIILADEFTKLVDGCSVGSNDLTQTILGVDRDSELLANLGYFDERNEAVKRAIAHLIKVAHANDCTVSICGQAPSVYPEFTRFLVEEGIDSISANPDVAVHTRNIIAAEERKILLEKARKGEEVEVPEFKAEPTE